MKCIYFFLLFIGISSATFAKKDTVTIGNAFLKKLINLTIKGKGGYQEECVSMKIKNNGGDSILLFIEAGRRLDSQDSTMQDILIVKDMYLALAAKQERTVNAYGFCCQAHNAAPAKDAVFSVGEIASKDLMEIARYINKAKLKAPSIQQAVWVISDNNEISSVVDDGTEAVSELRKFLAKLRNIETPWYNTIYKKSAQELFTGKPEKITGKIEYNVINDLTMVVANIRDESGTVVKSFLINKAAMRGNYTFDLAWDVSKMPLGKYTIRISANQAELKKLEIKLK